VSVNFRRPSALAENQPSLRDAMATREDLQATQLAVIGTASIVPPRPTGESGPCSGPSEAAACTPEEPQLRVSEPPPSAAAACYTGMTIDGRYVVESVLGEGGMGIVYLARHKVIGKKVALKILRRDFARQKEITDRFLQEARAASSIGNPHIIDISDFGELPDGSTYFAMEWLDGEPLSKLIDEHGTVPLERLVKIARQIADGLAEAHERGIVHRDLKPDNIFLVRHGSDRDFVKILDFGIAKVTNANSRETRAGTLFGTPHYMSPEQASGEAVDLRTDIYALGVILYELASGRLPFEGDNVMAVLTQHLYKRPATIRSLVQEGHVSPALEAVILKALSKKPAERYQTMRELSQDLAKIELGQMPDAVAEMMARSASMFPPELFNFSGPPGSSAEPRAPNLARRFRTPVFVGLGALALGSLVIALRGRHAPKDATSQASAAAISAAASIAAPVPAQVEAAPRLIEVLVATDPLDAHVFRGKEDLGSAPLTVPVGQGQEVALEIRRQGYKPQLATIDGSVPKLTIKLAPIKGDRAHPPAKKGRKSQGWVPGEIVNPWGKR
jgi:serine/threonine-protein kinase